ncbi:MAG: PadR family transcriptional regulator [Dehalococcoidia bacterium]
MNRNAKSAAGSGASAWPRTGRQADAGPRRNIRYELFVLGELMGAPQHGYRLRETLNRILGPFRQVSWGVLYPLIHDLEREGLIVAEEGPEAERTGDGGSNRQPHSYHMTAAGAVRFHAIMCEPAAYTADYPDIFMLKLNLSGNVTAAEQLSILEHHHAYLQTAADYLRREQQFVSNHATLPERERPYILRFLAYRLHVVQAELDWLDGEIARPV